MGGLFGVVSKEDCVKELFFGTDYHSHLGTFRGGMAVFNRRGGFERAIHNIENSPFRTKFESDIETMRGNIGIGCISDTDPQPLNVRAHFGNFSLTTVGKINNAEELIADDFRDRQIHFMEMSNGKINNTELVASLIAREENLLAGIEAAQEKIDGSLTLLAMTKKGIYAARDKYGRTPLIVGRKKGAFCISFEAFAYQNLGYRDAHELGPGEIVYVTAEGYEKLKEPQEEMKICAFLWTYYGYPTSTYEGINVESMRYRCGSTLAKGDEGLELDYVAGVPDSGTAHAIGYANASRVPFSRPLIKYTPTWPRSFMPRDQSIRNLIARMKIISVRSLIEGKRLLFIDDSIVRGTQMAKTADYLFKDGAKEVHVRSACPPIMYSCKYLNFSRSTSDMDLITRRTMNEIEGNDRNERLAEYADQNSDLHGEMVDRICGKLRFSSLRYHELDDMLTSIDLEPCKICTYCWNGKE